MTTSITVTVERIAAEDWLGVTDGLDIDATVERYAEVLDEALTAAFPAATVEVLVDRANQTMGSGLTDIESDDEDEDMLRRAVGEIADRVFNGRPGEYLVVTADAE